MDVLLKPEEAAQRLRLGRSKLYELLQRGDIPSVTIGRSRRVPAAALDAFVAKLIAEQTERAEPVLAR